MMVLFVSECEKKALLRTRRVLDAFADRIGSNTWRTVITQEGLIAVKKLLRKTASKSTAVSCHVIPANSRSRMKLLWIVGNRGKFNAEGIVAVNWTQKSFNAQWENDWHYLPLIKALVAVAALLHDWGKATLLFQDKLQPKNKRTKNLGDPLRHEWISCLLLNALIQQSGDNTDDAAWLNLVKSGTLDERALIQQVSQQHSTPLASLPPLAQLVAWLIVTHHRLPTNKDRLQDYAIEQKTTPSDLLRSIQATWGYQNKFDEAEYQKRLLDCFKFPHGLLSESSIWLKNLQKWSDRLLSEQARTVQALSDGAWRVVLQHARLSLMLGDHFYSSCAADRKWASPVSLYANTEQQDGKSVLKQKLDEHLVRVSENALRISQSLSRFSTEMSVAHDIQSLKRKSPQGFEWQDRAVEKIGNFRKQPDHTNIDDYGCFIINMASTGCGKTIANAKIMRALSADANSLRYILALGLRTLTLQTGDEYRDRIGLQTEELAVLIGSAAVKELHENVKSTSETDEDLSHEALGSESMDNLLDEDLDYVDEPTADFLDAIIPKYNAKQAAKNKAFLYKPVLACTIDHLMAATETTRGGRYILPYLRLLSSDLVIDEVDDFDGKDLIAIGRLIHLAGMLGRKVMLSSATIPPALAEGFFNVYFAGWQIHAQFRQKTTAVACAWVDEFTTHMHKIKLVATASSAVDLPQHCRDYRALHLKFTSSRSQKLSQQLVKRKARIVRCAALGTAPKKPSLSELSAKERQYFALMQQTALELHAQHHMIDPQTGKSVSFGVIRVANIPPCVALTRYLLQTDWPDEVAPKIMAYHSRQVLLLRHEQETHLDAVLKRKEQAGQPPAALCHPIIRAHLDSTDATQVIFILVATPVEEVGRDHDFDWAVVEPSSYRSIIQLAGRVRRHRHSSVEVPNIAVMQYNLKALRQNGLPAYCKPGYENHKTLKLDSHDLSKLVDETALNHAVNAIPRIVQAQPLQPRSRLADLEHHAMSNSLTAYQGRGAGCLQAWLTECWWMTALPQQLNRFRESSPDVSLYLVWQDDALQFCEKNQQGRMVKSAAIYGIRSIAPLSDFESRRLWLERRYVDTLQQLCLRQNPLATPDALQYAMTVASKRYGELTIPAPRQQGDVVMPQAFYYSDQFGLWPKK